MFHCVDRMDLKEELQQKDKCRETINGIGEAGQSKKKKKKLQKEGGGGIRPNERRSQLEGEIKIKGREKT